MRLFAFVLLASLLFVASASGQTFTPIPNSTFATDTWEHVYSPLRPTGSTLLGDVPFDLGEKVWGVAGVPGTVTKDINVCVFGATAFHTLINTRWGQAGPASYLRIEFFGSNGAYYAKELVGGIDMRDYASTVWTNSINGTTTVDVFNSFEPSSGWSVRMDKQRIQLPTAFASQMLTSVRITDTGRDAFQRAVLFGATVEVVPEPASLAALGLGALALLRRRKR